MGSEARAVEVAVVVGTRSEAVALAPVVRALRRSTGFVPVVVSTGQQRGVLDQVLRPLGVRPDVDLALPGAVPVAPARRLPPEAVERLGEFLVLSRPDVVLVHGDSASAFGAALAAFSEGFRVGHLGAGRRSGAARPSPEDANQRLIAPLTRWHLAPTAGAAANLVAEGVDPARITVTGSTGLDALRWAVSLQRGRSAFTDGAADGAAGAAGAGRVLVCVRLLEAGPECQRGLADALRRLAGDGADVVLPRHPDGLPRVLRERLADGTDGTVRVVPALDYLDYAATLRAATLVVTDSAAVREEAACLGLPVLAVGPDGEPTEADAGDGQADGPAGAPDAVPEAGGGAGPEVVAERVLEVLSCPLPARGAGSSGVVALRGNGAVTSRSAAAAVV